MSLCDLNCCDLKWLQTKFDAINKKISDNQKLQDRINANIFEILKESGTDVGSLLKSYYALKEDDYTKVLTSEDDINTLEPGTYKIISTDMPQNAPKGIGSSDYDGTLIQSNSYALLFENDFDIYYRTKTSDEIWTEWEQVAFMNDVPSLAGYATQDWVQSQNYLKEIPDDYATDTEVSQAIASALMGYATQAWVNEQIQDITGGAVTTDIVSQMISDAIVGYATQNWVKSQNYLTEIPDEYVTITELQAKGYQTAAQVNTLIEAALNGYATQSWVSEQIAEITGGAVTSDMVSQMITEALEGYATQTWVNQQGFLTEIPEEYITQTELQAQNYATQSWVTARGYQTSAQVDTAITEALNGYATQTWVNQQNFAHESDIPSLSGYATQTWVNNQNFATEEWVGQQGYQTVQQVNSLISTATADMLTQEDLDTLNYATENWVLQTALDGYATENWVNTKLNNYLPKKQTIALTTQGTYYGLQYQWVRYGQVVEIFLVGNLTQQISNQLISSFCPANPLRTLLVQIPGYDNSHYAEFNDNGIKLVGTYNNELYVNCHFTYLTND